MSKEPYYNSYQRADYIKLQAYKNVISELHKQRNVFVRTGLTDAAQRVWGEISMAQQEHDALKQKMVHDRETMAASLLEVILIANLAYAKAMEFSEVVKKCTGSSEDALALDVQRICKICEEVALSVDTAGNDKQSNAFSDVIDEIEEQYNKQLTPIVDEVMQKFRKTKRYQSLF